MRLPSSRAVDRESTVGPRGDARRRATGALQRIFGAAAPIAACVVVWHSLAFVLQHHPALPIADGWAPWTSLREVLDGRITPVRALVARHNEHRILLTRALFLLDLLDGGRDRISTAASLAFQAVQAGIWLVLLRRSGVGCAMGLLVGGTIVAMSFTLRQGDNFISGFQAQFTGVFALNVVAALLLLPERAGTAGAAPPALRRLAVGAACLLALPFVMANGLLAGPACALAGLSLRSRAGRAVALLALTASCLSVALDALLPSSPGRDMALAATPKAAIHAIAYLGGTVTSGRVPWAIAAGAAGILSSSAAVLTVLRTGIHSRAETVSVEAMLFTLMSAGATAAGRVGAGFGVEQALSGRYATGSAAFWAATLVFWSARLSSLGAGARRRAGSAALALGAALLLGFVIRDQHSYDRVLAEQSAAADRVLVGARAGASPTASDLARIGVDPSTATSGIALLREVRALDGIDAPPTHDDAAVGTLSREADGTPSPRTTSTGGISSRPPSVCPSP